MPEAYQWETSGPVNLSDSSNGWSTVSKGGKVNTVWMNIKSPCVFNFDYCVGGVYNHEN